MSEEKQKPIVLSDEQKAFITKNLTKPGMDMKTLVQQAFVDASLDLRSVQGKAVKEFVATLGKMPVRATKDSSLPYELSQEDKDFIDENYLKMSGPVEIARAIFKDPKMEFSSKECRAVTAYCRSIDANYLKGEEEVEEVEYRPPNSIIIVIGKLNRYLPSNRADNKAMFDRATITAQDEKNLRGLLGYMNIPRFKIEANKYLKKIDRELYESSFMQFTFDKPDLLAEEVHQYISLAAEIVLTHQIDKTVQKIDKRVNERLDNPDMDDVGAKLYMNEIEMLNTLRDKLNASKIQQGKLIATLVGARADRMDKRINSNATILNLVEAWKMEDMRKEMIELAEREKLLDAEEVGRLSDMESLKALISGISKEDAIG